jgi:hypothetical protein
MWHGVQISVQGTAQHGTESSKRCSRKIGKDMPLEASSYNVIKYSLLILKVSTTDDEAEWGHLSKGTNFIMCHNQALTRV